MLNSLHCRLVISLLKLTVTVLAVDTTLTGTVTIDDTAVTDCDTNYGKIMPFWVTQSGSD